MRYLTRHQAQMIDRLAEDRYFIPTIVLMENAARATADLVCDVLDHNCLGQVMILCGSGNNGGDGLALARHLHNRGAEPMILLVSDPGRYKGEALVNYKITQAMGIPTAAVDAERLAGARPTMIVDAIFGTGLRERPREPFDQLAQAAMATGAPILSVDIPSGLDADTGEPLTHHAMRATHTITFVAPKMGFSFPVAERYLGQVTIADIGSPVDLLDEVLQMGVGV
jgi:NAD(P)H-hydrate epimerase